MLTLAYRTPGTSLRACCLSIQGTCTRCGREVALHWGRPHPPGEDDLAECFVRCRYCSERMDVTQLVGAYVRFEDEASGPVEYFFRGGQRCTDCHDLSAVVAVDVHGRRVMLDDHGHKDGNSHVCAPHVCTYAPPSPQMRWT